MPRTKLNKKVTNKRNRNSTADDLRVNAMSDVDRGKYNIFFPFVFQQKVVMFLFFSNRNGNNAH